LLTATGASAQSLEQQAMCAKQAKIAFQEYEDNNKMFASVLQEHNEYQSHYNTKLNKCFIDIKTMAVNRQSITNSITNGDLLMDAFEQRVYAQYILTSLQNNIPTCDSDWLLAKTRRLGGCMAKERKTRHELEALVFEEAHKARECEGLTGVTVQGIEDDRVDYNWNVSFAQNNSTPMCARIIVDIVTRLQQRYDLATTN
jgi:hypothetical protein